MTRSLSKTPGAVGARKRPLSDDADFHYMDVASKLQKLEHGAVARTVEQTNSETTQKSGEAKAKAPYDPSQAIEQLDKTYHTAFGDWIRDPANCEQAAAHLAQYANEYDIESCVRGLVYVCTNWPVQKIGHMVAAITETKKKSWTAKRITELVMSLSTALWGKKPEKEQMIGLLSFVGRTFTVVEMVYMLRRVCQDWQIKDVAQAIRTIRSFQWWSSKAFSVFILHFTAKLESTQAYTFLQCMEEVYHEVTPNGNLMADFSHFLRLRMRQKAAASQGRPATPRTCEEHVQKDQRLNNAPEAKKGAIASDSHSLDCCDVAATKRSCNTMDFEEEQDI
eukprot:Clim_evm46s242 gene=Clim_evmTU46s242